MFKKNYTDTEKQLSFPCFTNGDVDKFLDRITGTDEASFYNLVFKNIDEDVFNSLYCRNNGRPNAPINTLVASLILRNRKGWSFVELIKQLKFNVAVRYAVGIFDFQEIPFNEATIFNFLNRVKSYNKDNQVNLFEKMFDSIVKKQIHKLKIKTDIIRTDSIMLNSNIKKYGRVELLLEVILRLYKIFSEKDKQKFDDKYRKYTEKSSEKFIYELKSSELSNELTVIGSIYYWINTNFKNRYEGDKEYEVFTRIFKEHFTIKNNKIEIKDPSEVGSDSLQSPDDVDATFRTKKDKSYRGFSGTVSETCNPSNPVNIIIDVAITANNVDDSHVLEDKFEEIIEKTGVKEIHVDGAYGSSGNDKICSKHEIMMVQTAIRGRVAKVPMKIIRKGKNYDVSCPGGQTIRAVKTRIKMKACFDLAVCKDCSFANDCGTSKLIKNRVYYFTNADFERNVRLRNIDEISEKRQHLRNNVEATMHEFSCKLNNHKLKVRGLKKATEHFILSAIGINFGRISRFLKLRDFLVEIRNFSFSIKKSFPFLKIFVSVFTYETKYRNYTIFKRVLL